MKPLSLLAVVAVFFLDAIQIRRFVNVEVRTNFDGHSGKAVFLQAYAQFSLRPWLGAVFALGVRKRRFGVLQLGKYGAKPVVEPRIPW